MTDLSDDKKNNPRVSARTGGQANDRFEEIRELEKRLIDLKQSLVLKAAKVSEEDDLNFLLMRVGKDLVAAPISQVEEVLEMPAVVPLNDEVRTVAGLINYHGEMLAVIDLAELLGKEKSSVSPDHILTICAVKPRFFALMVDEALEVVRADEAAITISDQVLPGLLKAQGVLKVDDRRSALIVDLGWIAMGAQLAQILSSDSATPIGKEAP